MSSTNQPYVEIFDTTLRDGAQTHGVNFSLDDKIRIALRLDDLGVDYIEGGWPGANPKDTEFFRAARKLRLDRARISAFGSTHRPGRKPGDDELFGMLVDAHTPVVTIFGKSWDFHVTEAMGIALPENLEIIRDSVAYLKERTDEVIYDAEHFFDGWKHNPEYCLQTVRAAVDGGASRVVLCDTNGGTLPNELARIIAEVRGAVDVPLGIHAHNDSEVAVANSLAAVELGAHHVQGTINGIGERCGNANLVSVIANLVIKQGYRLGAAENLAEMKDLSVFVAEMANHAHFARQPFVGDYAFGHKGGVHASAVLKNSQTYEHIKPELVGNSQRVMLSDQSGKGNIMRKAREFGLQLAPDSPRVRELVRRLKELEAEGYEFGAAESSFELIMRRALGLHVTHFDLISYRIDSERGPEGTIHSEASIRMMVGGKEEHTIAIGNGPVNALDIAMRKALSATYPGLHDVELVDYKVRVLSTGEGTSSRVRVLIESTDGEHQWNTVGVSGNVIEASWLALSDSIEYKLLLDEQARNREVVTAG